MSFRELNDFEWDIIRSLLPPMSRVGRLRTDDGMVLNGILYVLTTGCWWVDITLMYPFNELHFGARKLGVDRE